MRILSAIDEAKDVATKEYVDNKKYAGASSAGGAATSALSATTASRATRLSQVIRYSDTAGTSNKHAKLATITFNALWIGNTIRLFVVDAANGNANSEVIINARASGTTGGYVVNPTLRVNSAGAWGKSRYYLMYTGWSIELWCTCGSTDVINMEIFEICNDTISTVSIAYEQSLTWQTDTPTSGTKVAAIDGFSNYLPKTGGTVSGNLTVSGTFKTASSGTLLYSGSVGSVTKDITITDLSQYTSILISCDGVGASSLKFAISDLIPIAYLSKSTGNTYKIAGGIPSEAHITSEEGPIAAKHLAGYITVSMPSSAVLRLSISVGTIGNVSIVSI